MKVARLASFFLGLVCAGFSAAVAQTGKDSPVLPLPIGPLLRSPEPFSVWVITYAYLGDNEKQSITKVSQKADRSGAFSLAAPRRITLTYTKPLWRAVSENVNGSKVEQWSDGKGRVYEGDGIPNAMLVSSNLENAYFCDYGTKGFPDMEWVSAATYRGVQKVAACSYLLFVKEDLTVWVDKETRYPVKWQKGEEIRTFTQLPPPSAPLILPPEVSRLLDGVKKDMERLMRPIPRGG